MRKVLNYLCCRGSVIDDGTQQTITEQIQNSSDNPAQARQYQEHEEKLSLIEATINKDEKGEISVIDENLNQGQKNQQEIKIKLEQSECQLKQDISEAKDKVIEQEDIENKEEISKVAEEIFGINSEKNEEIDKNPYITGNFPDLPIEYNEETKFQKSLKELEKEENFGAEKIHEIKVNKKASKNNEKNITDTVANAKNPAEAGNITEISDGQNGQNIPNIPKTNKKTHGEEKRKKKHNKDKNNSEKNENHAKKPKEIAKNSEISDDLKAQNGLNTPEINDKARSKEKSKKTKEDAINAEKQAKISQGATKIPENTENLKNQDSPKNFDREIKTQNNEKPKILDQTEVVKKVKETEKNAINPEMHTNDSQKVPKISEEPIASTDDPEAKNRANITDINAKDKNNEESKTISQNQSMEMHKKNEEYDINAGKPENSQEVAKTPEQQTENTEIPKNKDSPNNLDRELKAQGNKKSEKVVIVGEESKQSPKSGRNIGLLNIGNSCYMNSVIQIFASIPEFIGCINDSNNPILKNLRNVITTLISSSNLQETEPFLRKFKFTISQQFTMFRGPSENDAKELFSIITNEADQHKPKNRVFSLIKNQVFICSESHKSIHPEESNFLVVPREKQKNLQDFLNNIKSKTFFCGNSKLFCSECQGLRGTEMEITDIDWPNILTFYLPVSQVYFSPPEVLEAEGFSYKIFGAICYYGNHFIAFLKDENSDRWKAYNDSHVGSRDPDWKNLYLVFYRRNHRSVNEQVCIDH